MGTNPVVPNLAAAVASTIKAPKGFTGAKTEDLTSPFFHGMVYGETDSRKTSTAAEFGGPEKTFILLTRSPEQLIPIASKNYHYARVESGDALAWALAFPEKAADAAGFPQWKDQEGRVLMVDDMTEGANLMVDDNSVRDDGSEVKDGRQIYKAVNDDLRAIFNGLKKRPMHLLLVALAKVAPSQIANEETIFPDMPTGARAIILAELEFCFYMDKAAGKMLTVPDYLTFVKKDEKGKPVAGKRDIFAKSKLPKELIGRTPPVLGKKEAMDLRAVWEKICKARSGK